MNPIFKCHNVPQNCSQLLFSTLLSFAISVLNRSKEKLIMPSGFILLLCVFLCHFADPSYAQLPSYIKPCSRSDANKKSCFTARANEVLPYLLNGDASVKLPSLSPMKIHKVETIDRNLRLTFKDVDVFGLDTAKITSMDVDFINHRIIFKVDLSQVSFIGEYEAEGQIMVLPVTGNGPFNITLDIISIQCGLHYKFEIKQGTQFSVIDDHDVSDLIVKKTHFKFDNLFNGNKEMGDNINKFLNENDQDVLKELKGVVTGVIKVISNTIVNALLQNVPFDELFLA